MVDLQDSQVKYRSIKSYENESITINWYKPTPQSKGLLFTKGLGHKNQHELANKTENIYPYIELYFLLPIHWDINQENQKWPIEALERLIYGQVNGGRWYGPGDTMTAHQKNRLDLEAIDGSLEHQNHEYSLAINALFKQNHFMLMEPIEAHNLLAVIPTKEFTWLGVSPIFQSEFDFKVSRSALELIMAFGKSRITELVDEHRKPVIKRRFFGLFWGRNR